jgi:hypothetical protein
MDRCSCARAGWADAHAPFAVIVAAGSVVMAAIASRVIDMAGGRNREGG